MKALLTGANSLVNEAMLGKLIEMGYDVTAHYHRENEITKRLKQTYSQVVFVRANFEEKSEFVKFLNEIKVHGPFDVIVNGAVYYAEAEDDAKQQVWSEWQKTFAINTTACGMLMAHANELMREGVIINISSTYGQKYMGDTQFTMYGASKAALDLLTENYAKKYYPDIRVVGIAPGWVRSSWNKDMSDKEIIEMVEPNRTKLIEPNNIANLLQQLIDNPDINATTVLIDSGLSSPVL